MGETVAQERGPTHFLGPCLEKLGVIYSCQDNLVGSIFVRLIPLKYFNIRIARKGKQDPGRGNYFNNFQWQGIKSCSQALGPGALGRPRGCR